MARLVRDSRLETRAARDRLKPNSKPYRKDIEPNSVCLLYRKRKAGIAGVWLVRRYKGKNGKGGGGYRTHKIAFADDFADANGSTILNYAQAQNRALGNKGPDSPLTVRQAMADYVAFLKSRGQATRDTELRIDGHIVPALGDVLVEKLTAEQIREWISAYANKPAWVRVKKGAAPKAKRGALDDEAVRRRRASANRLLTTLKAGLNLAFNEEKVSSNAAWGRRVAPFKGVSTARVLFLSVEEARRLVNASAPDFRLLLQGALFTGARYGELTRFEVADFNADAGTLHVRKSKSWKERFIVLTDEGVRFFRSVVIGRKGDDLIFRNESRVSRAVQFERRQRKQEGKRASKIEVDDRGDWRKSEQNRPMREAVARAKISPPISFHATRHTYASLSVMAGMPLLVLARNLGHRDATMVQRVYGHLTSDYVTEAIRASAPKFGFRAASSNVRSLRN